MSLLSLPPELLQSLLHRLDAPTLLSLSQTCRHLHALATSDSLWQQQLSHRFRSARPRFRTSSPRSPADVYRQWARQPRMPAGRGGGGLGSWFAKGGAGDVLGWVTVSSASDCKVGARGVVLRLVVQNVGMREAAVEIAGRVVLTEGRSVGAPVDGVVVVDRAGEVGCGGRGGRVAVNARETEVCLGKDDYVVVGLRVALQGAVHEVDVLERLGRVDVHVVVEGRRHVLPVVFHAERVWELYEYMPGNWWVRKDLAAGSARTGPSLPGL